MDIARVTCARSLSATLLAGALAACGGGGGGAGAATPVAVASTPSPLNLSNYNDATIWAKQDGYSNGGNFDVGWRADHATVNGSTLDIRLDNVPCPCSGQPYASDELDSVSKYGYGTYTVQMQASASSGTVSTFFTYVNTTPGGAETNDEIDVEIPGARTTTLEATYYKLGVSSGAHVITLPFDASQAIHTYAIQWLPNSISWIVDGQTLYTVTGSPATLPTNASNLVLNFWSGNTTGIVNWLGALNYSTPLHTYYGSASFTPAS